jgi:hypothetical protein
MSILIFNDRAVTPSAEAAGKTVLFSKTDGNMYYMGSDGVEKLLYTGSSGGGGAPTDAQYLTLALDSGLSNERKLTAGVGILFTDGGANGNLTLTVPEKGAPTGSQYLTLATDSGLANERVLTAGTGISFTDSGAGGTLVLTAKGVTMDDVWQTKGDLVVGLGDGQAGRLAPSTHGYGLVLATGAAGGLQYAPRRVDINIPIGDGTNNIATGMFIPPISIPTSIQWTSWYALAHNGVAGSFEIDIKKISYDGFPSGISIPGTATRPRLTGAGKLRDTTLTGWNLSVDREDVLQIIVTTGSSAIKLATVALHGIIKEVS